MTFNELGPVPVRIEVEHQPWPFCADAAGATHVQTFVRIRDGVGTFTFSDRCALVDLTERRDFEIETGRAVSEALAAWRRYAAIQKEAKR